jgi:hypothetical protein
LAPHSCGFSLQCICPWRRRYSSLIGAAVPSCTKQCAGVVFLGRPFYFVVYLSISAPIPLHLNLCPEAGISISLVTVAHPANSSGHSSHPETLILCISTCTLAPCWQTGIPHVQPAGGWLSSWHCTLRSTCGRAHQLFRLSWASLRNANHFSVQLLVCLLWDSFQGIWCCCKCFNFTVFMYYNYLVINFCTLTSTSGATVF